MKTNWERKKEGMITEDWLCNDILHTRVEHHGKSLNLVIDNGSGINVISSEVQVVQVERGQRYLYPCQTLVFDNHLAKKKIMLTQNSTM